MNLECTSSVHNLEEGILSGIANLVFSEFHSFLKIYALFLFYWVFN